MGVKIKNLNREKHELIILTKFLFTSELENKFANFEQEFLYIEGRLFNHKAENMICTSYTLRTPKKLNQICEKNFETFLFTHCGQKSARRKKIGFIHFF